MAFNIFSTLNQNLQNFGGDAYDAYQAGKSKVGNVASTINTNLQNFGGDLYDAGNQIKNNVSNFATQSVNTGKQVANQIGNNVSDANYNMWNSGLKSITGKNNSTFSDVGKTILAPADRFMQDITKIENAQKATQYGISEKDKSALMNQMLDAGQYSDDEIIQAVAQLDAEEKARKQQEFSDWQTSARENASTGRKLLSGTVDFAGGVAAGMMRLPAGVTDFVTGGTDYTKDTMKGINDFTSRGGAAQVGDIAGQIAGTALIPGVGRIAPSGTSLAATAGRGAVYGGAFGGLTPIMNKGSEATFDDIGESALTGAAMGAVTGPLLEKGIPALVKGTKSGIKAGQYTNGSISDKLGAGGQAFVKSMGRQTKQGVNETVGSISSAYQNAKPFVRDAVKKPYQFTQDKVQSLLSNSSDKTKSTIAQTYGLENQEIGALRNMGEQGVSDAMKKMEAIDKTALEGGGVNSIYDDLHKEIMTGVGKRSKEISTLEAQKDKILQSSPVVVTQAELESIFDDVLKAQGIQRTQVMTKKGIKNVYTVVGEGNITKGDMANIEKLYNEVFRTKGDVSALNMNTRIKNLQGNLYNSDGAAVYGSNSMTSTAKSIVAKVNDLLKKKLPPEYGIAKEAQSKILQQRQVILKALKEEDNALALLSDDAIANMSEEAVTKLINDSIAGNKMALVLRRLANSTTTGGDAKQLANIIKEFTGVDAESKAIALRAIAKLTGNQQIMNELGGLIEKGIMKGSLGFIRKTLAPSPDKVIKAVATKPPIVSKAKPKATKPPIVPKAKPKATTESAFKNNKGFINPSEIKKSLIPKKGADEARQFYDDLVYAGNSPIVAQRETAKRFGTIRAMSASKAGTFGGEGAKEAPKTGWFKGADGKMKFEIDDSKASVRFDKIIPENTRNRTKLGELQTRKSEIEKLAKSVSQSDKPKLLEEYNNIKEKIKNIEANPGKDFGTYEVKLSDVLKHDDLFKQYPNVKEIIVQPTTNIGESGSYVANSNTIKVSVLELNNPEKLKSTLLHEIQHAIQNKEGFARGGSINGTMFDDYNKLAGEVESRNVQTRMNMTAKERALKSVESTEDVPRLKQIVRLKNDGTSMSASKAGTMDIGKIPEELVLEAKKYKSADEFINAQLQPDDVVMFQGKVVKLKNFSGGLGGETKKWSGTDSKGDPVLHMSSKNIEPYRFSDRYGQIDVDSSLKSLTKNTSELKKKYENEIAIFDNYNSYKNKGVDEITIDKILTKRDPKWKDKLSVGEEAKNMIEGKLNDVPDFSKRKSIQELKQIYEQANKK